MLLVIGLVLLCSILYYFSTRKFNYWSSRNVAHPKPLPFFGNYKDCLLLKKTSGEVLNKLCEEFKNEPYFGVYFGTEPALLLLDPEIIRLVVAKDCHHFTSRELANYTSGEYASQFMFFNYGDTWKILRHNFSPIFSSAKLKGMFANAQSCIDSFERLLKKESKKEEVNLQRLIAKFTVDFLGKGMFGIDPNVMEEGSEYNPFVGIGDMVFDSSLIRGFMNYFRVMWPGTFYGMGLKLFPNAMPKFFEALLNKMAKERKLFRVENCTDLVLKLRQQEYLYGTSHKDDSEVKLKVDDKILIAQYMGVFGAGVETTAGTLTFTLFELAKNPLCHAKALKEVDEYLEKNKTPNFSCMTELPYLEACIDESMRLYPSIGFLSREVTEDYVLPTGLRLEKNLRVHLPTQYLHRSPKYFPDPDEFKPERFLPAERNNIKPYTYMPFGEGPRLCLGYRFAKMQMLAALVTLLKSYQVQLADRMPETLKMDPKGIVNQPTEPIRVKLIPRTDQSNND